jgi:uncharacterized repeat protein (TIGR01451 family)
VNGDGFSDVVVGAWRYDNGETDEGRAFLYHGSASGPATIPDWSAEGDLADAWFGSAVGRAGDVNGDGYSDVIVGAPGYANPDLFEGAAFVFHGSASGLSATAAWSREGDVRSANFGSSAAGAGDVNGDGYSDVIVAAPGYEDGQLGEGAAFVFHGSAAGLSPTADWSVESDSAYADLGSSVAGGGDVNGDGYSDVIVGARGYTNGELLEGAAFAFHGSASGLGASAAWTAEGGQAMAGLGGSVATAGDVNGDGYSDVIVGASEYDGGETGEGRACVYHGSPSGLSAVAAWTAEGNQDDAHFGTGVAAAGDVNGDGYSDVAVGAPGYNDGLIVVGRAYVYHGSASGLSTASDWSAMGSEEWGQFGRGLDAGDFNGDGYADLLLTGSGRVHLFHGNEGDGLDRIPRQARADGSAPIDLLGSTGATYEFLVRARGRSPYGRDQVRLEWEVKPLGVPYDLADVQVSDWYDTGVPGAGGSFVPLEEPVTPTAGEGPYRWRLRLRSRFPFPWQSHWMTLPYNAVTETELRVAGAPTPPELDATKGLTDADGVSLLAGDTVSLVVVVENLGGENATNVVVTDAVDPSLENLDAPTGSIAGSDVTWDQTTDARLAALAPAATVDLTLTGTVSCQVADGTQICNEDASWSVAMDEAGAVTRHSPPCLTVEIPDLTGSTKEVDPATLPAGAGSTVRYELTICNGGSGRATNVTVTDVLPADLDETTINAPGAADVTGNTITWVIAELLPGVPVPTCETLEYWVEVRADVPDGTGIGNTAEVTSDEWAACGSVFETTEAWFDTDAPNRLLRNHCTTLDPPCDLSAVFPLPQYQTIGDGPDCYDDPEAGVLTNPAMPLVFYRVTEPSSPNAVRCLKEVVGDTVRICY